MSVAATDSLNDKHVHFRISSQAIRKGSDMINAISIGASTLVANTTRLNVAANNLANANTTGFKRSRVDFSDVNGSGGVQVGAIQRLDSQGPISTTGRQFDLSIGGEGFFQVALPNGQTAFTRAGNFQVDANGQLVTANGLRLQTGATIPNDATSVSIGQDGTISVTSANNPNAQVVGNLTTARFANPGGLTAIGDNLFVPSASSGQAIAGVPGTEGLGGIAQGTLEEANTDIVSDLVNLLLSKFGFSLGTVVIRTGNEVFDSTVDLVG